MVVWPEEEDEAAEAVGTESCCGRREESRSWVGPERKLCAVAWRRKEEVEVEVGVVAVVVVVVIGIVGTVLGGTFDGVVALFGSSLVDEEPGTEFR